MDSHFKAMVNNKTEAYWKSKKGQHLSEEFKNLVLWMLSYKGQDRPTIAQIREHPWLQKPYDRKATH